MAYSIDKLVANAQKRNNVSSVTNKGYMNTNYYQSGLNDVPQNESLLNKIQYGIGDVIGGTVGAVGWIGDTIADPVAGTERAYNYLKNYGSSLLGTIQRTTPTITMTKDLVKGVDAFRKGGIKGYQDFLVKNAKDTKESVKEHGVEDIANVIDIYGMIAGGVGIGQGLTTVGQEVAESGAKGLLKTTAPKAPGFLMTKTMKGLSKISPEAAELALKATRGVGAVLTRNTLARAAGQVGLGMEKAGIAANIASQIRGGDAPGKINEKIIPDGNWRTAAQLIWGAQTDIPYIAEGLQKAGTAWTAAKLNAHRKSVYDEVIKVMGDTPESKKMLLKSYKMANGQSARMSDIITEMMIREAHDTANVGLQDMSPTLVKRFRDQFIKQGRWTDDNVFNIKHSELFAREGTVLNNKPTMQWLDEALGKSRTGISYGETGTGQLALPKAGAGIEKKIGGKVKGIQQSGTVFDVQNITKPKKKLSFVEGLIYDATQSNLGRKFSTKVDTGFLKEQTHKKIEQYLSDKLDFKKSKQVWRDLQSAVDAQKGNLVGTPDVDYLSNKTIKEVLRKNGILETKSKEVLKTIQEAVNDTLKENDIFSLKQKLSTYAPKIKQADKLYTAGRFKLRPGFRLMQQAETGMGAGMFKDDMKTDVGKEVFGKILAHKTWGKEAKKISGTVDAIQGMEKAGSGGQEAAKSAMARAAYFSDNFIEEFGKTAYAKKELARRGMKSVEELPEIQTYIKGLRKADDPVEFINKWIAGSRPQWEGGQIVGSKSKLEMAIKYATEQGSKKAVQIGEKIPLYKGLRSPWERQLHTVVFPYSYSKKFLGGGAKFLTTGKAIRPQLTYKAVERYADFRDNVEVQSDTNPKLKPLVYLMDVLNPVSTEYPLGFGGATPFYKAIDTLAVKSQYESGPKLANDVLKTLSPALKEYERIIGFWYNSRGEQEPKNLWGWMDTRSIYPKYREQNKTRVKGQIKALQKYYD